MSKIQGHFNRDSRRHFQKVLHLHSNGFKPAHRSVKMTRYAQMSLPFMENEYCSHVRMGMFYELMTQGFFGGQLWDSIKPANNKYKGWIKPDIIREEIKTIWESKACRQGHQMNFLDEQLERYQMFQILYPDFTIYFAFWRHSFKNIKSCKLSVKDLFAGLSTATRAGIVLPFSIIVALWKMEIPEYGVKRYEEGPWHNCTRIGSKFLNLFILDPDYAIDRIGLDPARFEYERRMSPSDFRIAQNEIDYFPFIIIKDTMYSDWVYQLKNEVPF